MDGNSSNHLCGEYAETRNAQSSRSQAVLTNHVKIGPVTLSEVFKSAGTLVTELQVPSQFGNLKSWVRISRGLDKHARHCLPTETDHQNSEAASSQQPRSCGRPRAQVTSRPSPVRYKAAPKPKLFSIGFSQRVWKPIQAKALTKRDCEIVSISRHVTKILRHTGCHESDGVLRWDHVLTRMPSAEQTQNW